MLKYLPSSGFILISFVVFITISCQKKASIQMVSPSIPIQEGISSWYGPGFDGRKTANGEIFDMTELTAAHKKLAFGTIVRVTNLENSKSVVVIINDRGPRSPKRVLDLSKAAAEEINMIDAGLVKVSISVVGYRGYGFNFMPIHLENMKQINQ